MFVIGIALLALVATGFSVANRNDPDLDQITRSQMESLVSEMERGSSDNLGIDVRGGSVTFKSSGKTLTMVAPLRGDYTRGSLRVCAPIVEEASKSDGLFAAKNWRITKVANQDVGGTISEEAAVELCDQATAGNKAPVITFVKR